MRALAQLLLFSLCLLSSRAFAVSLGEELILSRLGDPVEVEIEVLQWEDMDLERVEISAASRAEYEVFELTWLPVLEDLNFNLVGPDLDGNVRVLISSRAPLNEPFLELLLVLRWPGGSLRREYVLLFDPPGSAFTSAPVPAPDPAPVAAVVAPPAPQPEPEPPRVEEAVEPARLVALVAEDQEPAADNTPAPIAEAAPLEPETPAAAPAAPAMEPLVEPVRAPAQVEVPLVVATPTPPVAVPAPVEPEPPADEPLETAVLPEAVVVEAVPAPTPQADLAVATVVEPANAATPLEDAANVDPEPAAELPDARTQLAIEVDTLAPRAAAPSLDTTRRTYQVRSGDSLWNIARQFRPAGAGDNLYQMLLGIHELNRGSFINGNISLLKANALLQIPTADDIAAIDAAGAEAEFDRRWEAGTARFDAAQRGEAIPLFANSAPEEAVVAPIEPDLPPGVEAPVNGEEDDLIMVSASNAPQPLQLVSTSEEPPPDAELPDGATVPTRPGAVLDDAELTASPPAVALVTEPAASPEPAPAAPVDVTVSVPEASGAGAGIIVSRASLTAELETEVAAMRTRRASAEALAQQLQASLQRAQAERAAQASLFSAENLLLAGSALGLLVALLAGGVFSLRIAAELRAQRGMRDSNLDVRTQPAWLDAVEETGHRAGERLEPRLPEMEVVELEVPDANSGEEAPERPAPDTADLFARMDNILGTSANSPKK